MGIFGGEKYSKEAYKAASNEMKGLDSLDREGGEGMSESIIRHSYINGHRQGLQEYLDKQLKAGQSEANFLNEKYNQLINNAETAMKALEDFEKEKLGMSGKD